MNDLQVDQTVRVTLQGKIIALMQDDGHSHVFFKAAEEDQIIRIDLLDPETLDVVGIKEFHGEARTNFTIYSHDH